MLIDRLLDEACSNRAHGVENSPADQATRIVYSGEAIRDQTWPVRHVGRTLISSSVRFIRCPRHLEAARTAASLPRRTFGLSTTRANGCAPKRSSTSRL